MLAVDVPHDDPTLRNAEEDEHVLDADNFDNVNFSDISPDAEKLPPVVLRLPNT